jgi:hypothetical protein
MLMLNLIADTIHHRDTEDSEDAQRVKLSTTLCPLCVSVVNFIKPDVQR